MYVKHKKKEVENYSPYTHLDKQFDNLDSIKEA